MVVVPKEEPLGQPFIEGYFNESMAAPAASAGYKQKQKEPQAM